jgi:hypothetical protein
MGNSFFCDHFSLVFKWKFLKKVSYLHEKIGLSWLEELIRQKYQIFFAKLQFFQRFEIFSLIHEFGCC